MCDYELKLKASMKQLNMTEQKFLENTKIYQSYARLFLKSVNYQGSPLEETDFLKRIMRKKYNNDFFYLKLGLIYKIWVNKPLRKSNLLVNCPILSIYLKETIEAKYNLFLDLQQEKFEEQLLHLHEKAIPKSNFECLKFLVKKMISLLRRKKFLKCRQLYREFYDYYFKN